MNGPDFTKFLEDIGKFAAMAGKDMSKFTAMSGEDYASKEEKFIMNYFEHLLANWRVAFHSLNDFIEHFIHGIFPFISWKHYHKED